MSTETNINFTPIKTTAKLPKHEYKRADVRGTKFNKPQRGSSCKRQWLEEEEY